MLWRKLVMARKKKRLNRRAVVRAIEALSEPSAPPRPDDAWAQLKVRLPEPLRRQIESAARRGNRSLNSEIASRLTRSFTEFDTVKTVAAVLIDNLDADILREIDQQLEQQRKSKK
jgi:hypothetical protein